jgi:hypothetical protein
VQWLAGRSFGAIQTGLQGQAETAVADSTVEVARGQATSQLELGVAQPGC